MTTDPGKPARSELRSDPAGTPVQLAAEVERYAEALHRVTEPEYGAEGWATPEDACAVVRHLSRTAALVQASVHHARFMLEYLEHAELLETVPSDSDLDEQLHVVYGALDSGSEATDDLYQVLDKARDALEGLRRRRAAPLPLRGTTKGGTDELTRERRRVLPLRRTWGPDDLIEPDPLPTAVRDGDGLRWIPGPGFWVYPDYQYGLDDEEWGRSLSWPQLLQLAGPLTEEGEGR